MTKTQTKKKRSLNGRKSPEPVSLEEREQRHAEQGLTEYERLMNRAMAASEKSQRLWMQVAQYRDSVQSRPLGVAMIRMRGNDSDGDME